jgi:hypothetical protein
MPFKARKGVNPCSEICHRISSCRAPLAGNKNAMNSLEFVLFIAWFCLAGPGLRFSGQSEKCQFRKGG